MGCSASRPNTHFTTPAEDPSPSSCSHSSPHFSSSSPSSHSSKNPISRTLSLPTPLVHHPPLRKGDTNHLVSLTSTTYGSLVLINHSPNPNPNLNGHDYLNHSPTSSSSSSPPQPPDKDPIEFSSPDSVINTWELMDGLDDFDVDSYHQIKLSSSIHDRPIESPKKPNSGIDGSVRKLLDSYEIVKASDIVVVEKSSSVSKPLWKHLSEESMLAKMDSNVVSSYRRALSSRHLGSKDHSVTIRSMESSPMNFSQPRRRIGSLGSSPTNFTQSKTAGSLGSSPMNFSQPKAIGSLGSNPTNFSQPTTIGSVGSSPMSFSQPKAIELLGSSPMIFSQPKTIGSLGCDSMNFSQPQNCLSLPGTEERIVMYITSLRGIRKTYEDCCTVRMIFRGFRVTVDERDISMDSAYRKELQAVLGKKAVSLPQVFIRGKYVGGADEVKQLHEVGELGNFLEGFPAQDLGFICKSCGDARFVPCQNCNGSRKVFEEEEGRLRRCSDCNENGLIRCPTCCS